MYKRRNKQQERCKQAEPSGRRAAGPVAHREAKGDDMEYQPRLKSRREKFCKDMKAVNRPHPNAHIAVEDGFKQDHPTYCGVDGDQETLTRWTEGERNSYPQGCLREGSCVRLGNGVYRCSYCGKSCSQFSVLAAHEKTHTREKPYKCSHCPKAFSRSSDRLIHEKVHSRRSTCKCSYCGRFFSRNWLLVLHERTHVQQKPFTCSRCGQRFSWKSHFIIHERAHCGEGQIPEAKPYKCSLCEESFSYPWLCEMHEGTHTGEKRYECSQCGKRFYSDVGLSNHERIHAEKENT